MEESMIRKYSDLMRELDLTAIEVDEQGSRIRLERNTGAAPNPAQVVQIPENNSAADGSQDLACIRSSMVGVFYSAPAENEPPYVSVGDTVRKGDIICIIEAMKLMNEITAEEDGTLVEICVGNGQAVDYGHVLFRLRKDQ